MDIGEKLRKMRVDMKKTLKEQGETFGVSLNSIYRWEHGFNVPKKAMLKRLADYYGVSVRWLLGEEDDAEYGPGCADIAPCQVGDAECQLLRMYNKLSDFNKYKILGYIERTYVEEMDRILDPVG